MYLNPYLKAECVAHLTAGYFLLKGNNQHDSFVKIMRALCVLDCVCCAIRSKMASADHL